MGFMKQVWRSLKDNFFVAYFVVWMASGAQNK
jgi:hypothetical protein